MAKLSQQFLNHWLAYPPVSVVEHLLLSQPNLSSSFLIELLRMLFLTADEHAYSVFLQHRPGGLLLPLPYIVPYVSTHIQTIVNHFQGPLEIHKYSLHRSVYVTFSVMLQTPSYLPKF